MPSELLSALFKRRSDVESAGQVWESKPAESSADAGALHLEGLAFDGPSAQEWLKQLEPSPEEDLLADAINEGLAEREQAVPSHLPLAVKPEEKKRLTELAAELQTLQDLFSKERERLGAEKEEVRAKQSEIAKREAELQAQQEEQKRREEAAQEAKRNYPQPAWLDKVEGCMNLAVVGNSGVGKSLLINRLRRLRPQAEGWAAVGVNETTREPSMYPYPNQPKVRLWDLPGAGTSAVPAETYLQDMGLRYFDRVVVVSAGRFTEMEVALRAELERHSVPYYMVRTKVDQDIANNKEDNFVEKQETLKQIREDLEKKHNVDTNSLYLVSSRDPDDYDFPRLLADLFPGLKRQMDPHAPAFCPAGTSGYQAGHLAPSAWNDAWAMPPALSLVLSGLQGGWCDEYGCTFLVQNDCCHVTLRSSHYTLAPLSQDGLGSVWWLQRWYVDEEAIRKARRSRELRWMPKQPQDQPLTWWMKKKSVEVPALKDLLDRPLDLETVELMEQAMRTAGFGESPNWWCIWGDAFKSLKPHGSSPENVLDLLCLLNESSDEKMQQMDLDDVTLEQVAAARSALREAIGKVELSVKKGERWDCRQGALWISYLKVPSWPKLGSKALPGLQALDARARILMTRLEDKAEKENHTTCLQEASLNTKQNELHVQVQQLTQECERLKQEESQRQALTLQLQQLQLECKDLRKRQEEHESLRLKEEESRRQEHALQIEQLHLECENLRKRQDQSESERLKEKSQRQALTLQLQALQLQQLQLENEKLKKKEFKFNSLVATAESLKSKVEQFCNECEKCDAEDVSQPDSSWELCTLMTEGSGISIDTAGRCFMREAVFKAALGGFVSGQDLRKGSQILAADGSMVEVAHPPEVSEKRGKVVLQTEKAKLEVTADHRVVNVTHEGAQRQVPAFKLHVGDLVMVDNQTESLTHVDFDPATFEVLKIGFSPDKPVEAFSLPPMIQSHGHKIVKCHRGRRGTRRAGEDDLSIPDTQGYYSD